MKTPKLIVVVGETASGKSALALELAKKFNGEIICADSRTVYKNMDVSTAKPTAEEQAAIPHHLLDVVQPDERFTVADFKRLANEAITDISTRGKLPIMAGGSGLYVDALIYDYAFKKLPTAVDRDRLRPNTLILGLRPDRETLRSRIEERADDMIRRGLADEIRGLAVRYGWDAEALRTPAAKAFHEHIEGNESLQQARQRLIKNDLDLAKRQRTWFKRNKSIQWSTTPVKWPNVVEEVTTFLSD